ncbi:inositol monophosphatase family protein [Metabacillus arenae]|uniref:Inositol monophosphatase family protein n=1 Tax=Metabacillus arenae TaxID=2771434 RepID=A0A926NCN3_9BACI|nr:inositol monophosphatase family protein [Metabacillus arenae]MBD1381817.1 inositol monophosphatase family protein [Metabacillus arenae]
MDKLQKMHTQILEWLNEIVPIIKGSLSDDLMIETKINRKDLVTNIDKKVQDFLVRKITETYPTHFIVGEESPELKISDNRKHVWIIDPIDGTANLVKQLDHFCVLIAYYENDIGKLGYIFDVMNDDLYYAIENKGAFLNNQKLPMPEEISLQEGLISADVRDWYGKECFGRLAEESFDIRYFGCGGIDSIHVITGKFAAFATSKAGPWDLAAQLVFAKELGMKVSHFDGRELHYLDHGDWVISNKGAYDDLLTILKGWNC